jgi:precorrin-6B methylase 2
MSKILTFISNFLKNFNESMNMNKLKKLGDYTFYLAEKIILNYKKFIPFYMKFYEEMVIEEIKMANISSDDKILHIGCGSIPATSIIIAKETGANIVAIDIDPYSSQKAKQFIKQNTKLNNIIIKNADGAEYSTAEFDTILISDGVKKLYNILQNISESLRKNTKVIFRITILNNENFKLIDNNLASIFEIKEIKTHKSYGKLSSVLLMKINSINSVKYD